MCRYVSFYKNRPIQASRTFSPFNELFTRRLRSSNLSRPQILYISIRGGYALLSTVEPIARFLRVKLTGGKAATQRFPDIGEEVMTTQSASLQGALDDAWLGAVLRKVWFLSAMGVFIDGFDLFIIAIVLPLISADLNPSAAIFGLIGATALLGAVVGAAVGVFLLPVLKQSLGLSITLLVVAIASLLGLAVTAFLGVETRGRSLA
jgi:hypothetical protein